MDIFAYILNIAGMINFPNLYIATWIMTVTHGKKIISAINNTLLSCAYTAYHRPQTVLVMIDDMEYQ